MQVALKLFCLDKLESNPSVVTLVPAFTDNRGNVAALNKLMSTKFPSSALVMELSTFLKEKKIKALVEWTPRESNREADLLANGITSDFNPSLEMKLDPLKPDWLVQPQVLDAGGDRQRRRSWRQNNRACQTEPGRRSVGGSRIDFG